MKKSDLKRVIKPIVKECILESLIEEGILSNIISEVIKGSQPVPVIVNESYNKKHIDSIRQEKAAQKQLLELQWKEEQERKRKLLDATGFTGTNLFEGTEPLTDDGSTGDAVNPFAGISPSDPGVDIAGIMAIGGTRWKKLIK